VLAFDPGPQLMPYVYGLALLIAGTGALTDYRTGHIPNWLTLPPLVIAPLVYGLAFGWDTFLGVTLGIVLCGVGPVILFYMNGMAGGDVKLFAAIAALIGPDLGLQAELLALVVAGIYSLGRLAWDGKLFRTLGNMGMMGLNPILPKRFRRPMARELRDTLRLGGAIFAGLLIAVLGQYRGRF